jgi:hypothetical protein
MTELHFCRLLLEYTYEWTVKSVVQLTTLVLTPLTVRIHEVSKTGPTKPITT